jgi:RHS repeat-associated protein
MADPGGNEPVPFDDGTADALVTAFNDAASDIEGQSGSRSSLVTTASQEFRGLFSELFTTNAATAATGASALATSFRAIADFAGELKEAAKQENDRRRKAREWQQRQDDRNWFEERRDDLFGGEEMPREQPEPAPRLEPQSANVGTRETPAPGSGGGGGGTSSAKPDDLRSFATGSAALDGELTGRPSTLSGKLADFASDCQWGVIQADGVVASFTTWLNANATDVAWANTVAAAFEAAGGSGVVSTVADSALASALQAAGVQGQRDDLVVPPAQGWGSPPTTGFTMDPVNTTTGNFLETEVDLAFAGAASSLRVSRTYNSLDDHVGPFGPGWGSVLELGLALDDEGAAFTMDDGRVVTFPRLGSSWDRAVGENFWLAAEVASTLPGLGDTGAETLLVVRDNTGGWWAFSPAGVWLASGGGAGTVVRVTRAPDGLPSRLTHARGRTIDIDYVDGRVATLTASDGRRVEYAYDSVGRLTGAANEVGTRRYDWNDAGLVERVTSASGVVEALNTYDEQGRVTLQVSPHGRTVRFAYLPGRVTVVSDVDGSRSNTYIADSRGRLVGVVDSDDRRQSMSYDPSGNLVSVTERDGSITVNGFDERGRKVRTVTPSGADLTYGYDALDRVTTVVTESGAVVEYEYADDAERNPSALVDPEGGRTLMRWREGLLESVVDPTGVVVRCHYDEFGDLVATENAVGDVARIERDHAGRPWAAVSPSGARTTYTYDAAGLLVSRRDADGAIWRFEHGAGARLTAIVDPLGARTEFGYGPHGDLETTTDPLGRVVSRRFDDQGDVSALELPDGSSWAFAHDGLSRLRTITDPAGHDWTREYDVTGALTATVDPTGVRQEARVDRADGTGTLRDAFGTTTLRFDEFGRPVATEAADGSAELTTYDRCGRPVELVDGEGGLTRLERDAGGRVIAVVSPSGARTTYEYDSCGRASASIDPLGARTTLTYDADSRVVARTLPTGDVERVRYDAVGRVVSRSTPGHGQARFDYDAAGRLIGTQDTRYGRRRFRYDAAGQLIEAENGLGGITRYEYDALGRVVAITDPLGAVTRRTYDARDKVTSVTDALGRTTSADYDGAGRQILQRDPDGHVTEWLHDEAGRKIGMVVDGRRLSTVSRDPFSRSVVVTDHTRGDGGDIEHELTYDRRGALVRRSRGESSIAWEYDADGRRTARIDPDGTRTEYRRDAAGRIVSVLHAGVESSVAYDAAGRVIGSAAGDLLQNWIYADGDLVEHTTTGTDGARTTRITRDDAGRIARVTGPGGDVEYGYDDACQLTSLRADGGSYSTWVYDLAGRLIRESVDGAASSSVYDAAGQVLSRSLPDGRRLDYIHDGLGRRVREIASDGSYVEYAWSDLGWLDAIVERQADDTEARRTDLWVDALGELAAIDGAETWWDSANGVPALVSIDGASVFTLPGGATQVGEEWLDPAWRGARATDATDPWGSSRASSALPGLELPGGASLTATGGLQVGGLEWLGARVYDPAARGFLSVDPLAPVTGAAWAGNPYSYAGNDPMNALDPLGLKPATDADLDAYANANQGAMATAGQWIADHKEEIIGGLAIAVAVGLMFIPAGPILSMALLAGSGALLNGGLSVVQQKAETGKVDWMEAGKQSLIGLGTGLVGGGAAIGLAKLAPTVARAAAPAVQRVVSTGSTTAGRSAIASGTQGATANVLDYSLNNDGPKTVAGYAGSAVTGFATGTVLSGASTKVSSGIKDAFGVTPRIPDAWPRHLAAPNVTRFNNAVTGITDHTLGGVQGAANELIRPGGNGSAGDFTNAILGGFASGAGGPTTGLRAER